MLHDNFIKTTKQESPEFVALLNILSSLDSHTEEGRKLLCVLNNIIDYYIHREIDPSDDVKMPIVYFPVCEDWAQMLCEEFVALKMSLLWGKSTRTNILSSYKTRPFIYLPERANKKEREACTNQFRFKREVAKHLTDDIIDLPSDENEKCFLYSRTLLDEYNLSLKTKGHYHFIKDIVGDSFSADKSLIILSECIFRSIPVHFPAAY